jgi:hypothetical protein
MLNIPVGLVIKEPVPGCFLIQDFDRYVGVDCATLIAQLDNEVPSRGKSDRIAPGMLQWVRGDHPDLMYRGNELRRRKIWAQDGTVADGVRIYSYTGFCYPVAHATSDWNEHPLLTQMSNGINDFMAANQFPSMNHLIVTAYDDGSHNIGFHFDKAHTLLPAGMIAILKLGPCSRRFALRKRAGPSEDQEKMPMLFDEVVPAGTLILMSLDTNLATQHGVPVAEDESVALSGSIVWRNVSNVLTQQELAKKVETTEKGRSKRRRSA